MATITQQPARLDLQIVAGDPFGLLLTVNATDANGNPIPWGSITNPVVVVSDRRFDGPVPTITSPATGQWLVSWSGAQTAALNGFSQWSLSATIASSGPLTLVAGNLATSDSTVPGLSSSTDTATLAVDVGTANVDITVGLGGGGGINIVDNGDGTLSLTPFAPTSIADNGAGLLTITT